MIEFDVAKFFDLVEFTDRFALAAYHGPYPFQVQADFAMVGNATKMCGRQD